MCLAVPEHQRCHVKSLWHYSEIYFVLRRWVISQGKIVSCCFKLVVVGQIVWLDQRAHKHRFHSNGTVQVGSVWCPWVTPKSLVFPQGWAQKSSDVTQQKLLFFKIYQSLLQSHYLMPQVLLVSNPIRPIDARSQSHTTPTLLKTKQKNGHSFC